MKTSAYTPFEVSTRDRIVGVFVIGAMLLFLIGFLIPFIQRFSADEGRPFHTTLDKTYGIAPDSVVTMRGVLIGNVTQVAITDTASVLVEFKLSTSYSPFYTQGSRLAIDSNLGISTILSGSGLILTPGPQDAEPLTENSFIVTDIPQGIGTILETLDIVQLSDQVTEIVSNIEGITTGVNSNQHHVYASLKNLEQVTKNLTEVTAQMPAMMVSVEQRLENLEQTMANVDRLISSTDQNLQPLLQQTAGLTAQATSTLAKTEVVLGSAEPLIAQLPRFLITTQIALQSITELTDSLSSSWLLGGGKGKTNNTMTLPALHPHDDNLYSELGSKDTD